MDIGRRRWGVPLVVLGLAATVALGGCSAGDDSARERATDSAAGGAAAPEAAPPRGADQGRSGSDQASGGAGGADLRVDQRVIIYTGSLRVQVDDVDRAARDATALATGAGGFVGGDERRGVDENARAELRLRVPAARFTGVVDGLAQLGRQQWREVSTEDVTEETIDLDARIVTQRARVESARKLLARASSISDLVTLENELGRREADLASLEAKKRRLADLTALSTITVTLVGKGAPSRDTDEPGFLSGLADAWDAFRGSVIVLVTVFAALLPWLLLLAVPVVLVWRLARRRRARQPAPVGPYPPLRPLPPTGAPAPAGAGPRPTVPAPRPGGDGGAPLPTGGPTPVAGSGPGQVSEPPPAPGAPSAP